MIIFEVLRPTPVVMLREVRTLSSICSLTPNLFETRNRTGRTAKKKKKQEQLKYFFPLKYCWMNQADHH
jgi:hypothetical protein